jgi:hypothetical protein
MPPDQIPEKDTWPVSRIDAILRERKISAEFPQNFRKISARRFDTFCSHRDRAQCHALSVCINRRVTTVANPRDDGCFQVKGEHCQAIGDMMQLQKIFGKVAENLQDWARLGGYLSGCSGTRGDSGVGDLSTRSCQSLLRMLRDFHHVLYFESLWIRNNVIGGLPQFGLTLPQLGQDFSLARSYSV